MAAEESITLKEVHLRTSTPNNGGDDFQFITREEHEAFNEYLEALVTVTDVVESAVEEEIAEVEKVRNVCYRKSPRRNSVLFRQNDNNRLKNEISEIQNNLIETVSEIPNLPRSPSNMIEFTEQNNSLNLPKLEGQFLQEIRDNGKFKIPVAPCRPHKRLRLSCQKIDTVIKISNSLFFKQMFNYEVYTMRCFDPLEDIFDLVGESQKKQVLELKKIKPITTKNDDSILNDILSYNTQSTNTPSVENRPSTTVEDPPFDPSPINQNPTQSSYEQEQPPQTQFSRTESHLSKIDIPFQDFNSIMTPSTQEKPSSSSVDSSIIITNQTVFKKLIPLWEANQYPITMKQLCVKESRKNAVKTFSALLVLHKMRYVSLEKKENSCEISHIAMGSAIPKE